MTEKSRIPKLRLDALTDGVFAVAMTLLVIDLKLPESFRPADPHDFLHGLAELQTQFVVYVVSFLVLGVRWMSLARASGPEETVNDRYVRWALAHLFLITCIPFSTMVVGRFAAFAPAIWLYAANTMLSALVALRIATLAMPHHDAPEAVDRRAGLYVLIALSLASVAVSFVQPRYALLVYILNAFAPTLRLWRPAK
jgi:TMEM175 potassium channel family protein